MSRVLHSDQYVVLTLDEANGVVRYARTKNPYPSIDLMRDAREKILSAVQSLGDRRARLLIDVRDAPPRNDDAFEHEVMDELRAFTARFGAHAILVKTAVGRLQVQRMGRAERAPTMPVFDVEADALAYLLAAR